MSGPALDFRGQWNRVLTPDQILHDFAASKGVLPRAAMRWALEHWDEVRPRFLDLLWRYVAGDERSKESENSLFFVIHLFGDKGETAAFPALCRLCLDHEALEWTFGDGVFGTLAGILISTFDGEPAALERIVEAPAANEDIRDLALRILAYLTRAGALPEGWMRSYLLRLVGELRPQEPNTVWLGWVLATAYLGYEDYAAKAEEILNRFIDSTYLTVRRFRMILRETLDDPTRMIGFAGDRIAPFADAIGTLSKWASFSGALKAERERREAPRSQPEPVRMPAVAAASPRHVLHRHVGRNAPCPCGSGRKYKRCCLP